MAAVFVAILGVGGVVGAYVVHAQGQHPKGYVESPQQADKRAARESEPHVKAVHPKRDPALVMSVRQLVSVEPYFVVDLRSRVPGVVRYVLKDKHDPVKRGERAIDRLEVAPHDLLATLAVGLLNRDLDRLDCLLSLQHAGDREEARLQHRVGPPSEPRLARDLAGIDRIQLDLLGKDLLLHGT